MAKATLVTIEPSTEDDWEVMELNSELAEAAILNQVLQLLPSQALCASLCLFIVSYLSLLQ